MPKSHAETLPLASDRQNFANGKILQILSWIFEARHKKKLNGQKVRSF
jgi:hypothetical protein